MQARFEPVQVNFPDVRTVKAIEVNRPYLSLSRIGGLVGAVHLNRLGHSIREAIAV
jgi:hypothetical protein